MSKFKNGLLLLRNQNNLYKAIKEAGKQITHNLYIDFLHLQQRNTTKTSTSCCLISRNDYFQLINSVYSRPEDVCRNLELHVLLPVVSNVTATENTNRKTLSPVEVCIIDNATPPGLSKDSIESNIKALYEFSKDFTVNFINVENTISQGENTIVSGNFPKQSYPGVVIGGTFDNIHDGHKLLLSTALLLADEKVTIGVADGVLLGKKVLKELIQPVDARIRNLVELIELYKPGLKHKVVPICDPCGPSGTDDDLQLLVVSEETIKGGPVVNSKRKENNLPELDVFNINLVGESPTDLAESLKSEGKLSSSAERMRLLGKLRIPQNHPKGEGCYVIGVTGGIASGKSSMVKRLQKLGAYVIDCDKLGHDAYKLGMPAYTEIVKQFGTGILDEENQTINRRKLGPIVFSDPSKLQLLNSIVWPEIHRMKQEKIAELSREGKYKVAFFEGAVLFEAGWDKEPNEIWCCVIPKNEAVQRIMNRNGLPEEEALRRVESQMTNDERVKRSHVILSTLWEPEFSQKQCENAWELLNQRIGGVDECIDINSKY